MNIQMLGIDHTKAAVEAREIFSFTKSRLAEALQHFFRLDGIQGCVMLSTCNRMELYISTRDQQYVDLYAEICKLKNVSDTFDRSLFTERFGEDAVSHLFYLASGMESRILGEDQILMQVKEALNLARENESTDKVMEVLFRMAVTVGKKVRTNVHFSHGNTSAVTGAICKLKQMGYVLNGKKCLVIGNGEMGRLAATAWKEEGAEVIVTLRQYRSGEVKIPRGCSPVLYGDRYRYIPDCDYIISATASPNLTITRDNLEKELLRKHQVFLDLAVPRDIDPEISEISGITLFDIDDFTLNILSEDMIQQKLQAKSYIEETLEEFVSWYECREVVPMIQQISRRASKDVSWRMGKTLDQMHMDENSRRKLEDSVDDTSAKVISRLLFKLRDHVSPEILRDCLDAFEAAYPEGETYGA